MTESPLDDALRKDIDYLRERAKDDGPKVPGSQHRSVYASPKRLGEIADHMEEKLKAETPMIAHDLKERLRRTFSEKSTNEALVRRERNYFYGLPQEPLRIKPYDGPAPNKPTKKKKQLKRPTRRIKLCD